MVMAVQDIMAGTKTIGDFVMVDALLLQLFIPLNFMGMVYREIKQSLTDIERMMDVLAESPEVADRAERCRSKVAGGTIRFWDIDVLLRRRARHGSTACTSRSRRQVGGGLRPVRSREKPAVPATRSASTTSPAGA